MWGLVAASVLASAPAVRADNLIDRWRLFTPASAPATTTTPHPAVVRVIVDEGRLTGSGSGSFVASRDQYGLVVTNWHVVRDAKGTIQVVFPDGFRSEGTVLKTDQDWDLAALLIWKPSIEPLRISSTAPQTGDPLTIHGYGPGDYRAVSGKCTQYLAPSVKHPYEILELSVAARQGDSGGPILNDRGELAGVLFGADRRTTSGSYCGRVRWFLSAVWPELAATSEPGGGEPSQTVHPFVGFPSTSADSGWGRPTPTAPQDLIQAPPQNLVPIHSDLVEDRNGSLDREPDPADVLTFSTPYATPTPLPPPASRVTDWKSLLGATRWDQAKSALAILGLLAVWGHLSRWLSR